MREQTKIFHRLEHISQSFDRVIEKIRSAEIDKNLKVKNWIVLWFLLPLLILFDFKSIFKSMKALNFSTLVPLFSGTVLYSIVIWTTEIHWLVLLLCIMVVAYLFSFIFLAPKSMCSFDSKYFRIGAYSLFRSQEYELFKSALGQDEEFYFSAIPKELQLIIQENRHYLEIHNRIDCFLNQEKNSLEAKLQSALDRYTEKEEAYTVAVQSYDDEFEKIKVTLFETQKMLIFLIEFIKSVNIALYRKKNKCFKVSDMVNMIGTGITIYELDEEKAVLNKIYDEGTTGISPKLISLDAPYSTAAVVRQNDVSHKLDEPSQGRFVVSRLFKMGYGKKWVINFHPDITQEKALLLTIPNDILDTDDIMRVIHSMCLIMQETNVNEGEEG